MKQAFLLSVGLVFLVGSATGQEKDPKQILNDVYAKWKTVQDYHCMMQSNNRLGEEKDLKKIEFWFKLRHQVRMEVLDGEKKGSALTRNDAGRIRGRKGGLLKVIPVTLDENDERIFNLRGRKFYEADWGTVIKEVIQRVKNGWTLKRLADEMYNQVPCLVLELTGQEPESGVTKDMIWVDQVNHLILHRKQFEGTLPVNEVAWWEIQLNTGLGDDLFDL